MKQKILITGGAGYIGSHTILEVFRNTDFGVISIDNHLNSTAEPYDAIEKETSEKIIRINIDICDKELLFESLLPYVDEIIGVIHFAALKSVPDSVADPILYYKNNNDSLLNILEFCGENNITNLIFSSSCSVYGNVKKDQLPVKEDTRLGMPVCPYAETKVMGEMFVKNVTKKYGYKSLALRYFNPVGADSSGIIGESPLLPPTNLAPVITRTALGIISKMKVFGNTLDTRDGSCIRDYIHVSDIAIAHVKALQYLINIEDTYHYDVINLGSGNGVTVLEAIAAFEKVTGIDLNYEIVAPREGDAVAIYSNCEKSERLLDWKAKYTIEDMMKTTWEWEKKNFSV